MGFGVNILISFLSISSIRVSFEFKDWFVLEKSGRVVEFIFDFEGE